jgi:hypothetical protein
MFHRNIYGLLPGYAVLHPKWYCFIIAPWEPQIGQLTEFSATRKIYYHVYKKPPLVTIPSQLNPFHTFPSYL